MRYKAAYGPAEILDPATNTYNPLDDSLKSALAEHHYYSPSDAEKGINEDENWSTIADPFDGQEMMDPGWSWKSRMPGLMSREEVEKFNIARVMLKIGSGDNLIPACVGHP